MDKEDKKRQSAEKAYEIIKKTGVEPEWNFNKYLISKNGEVKHFNQKVEPDNSELVNSIKKLL